MKNIIELERELSLSPEQLEKIASGAFVGYHPVKAISASISLSSSDGIIAKKKRRLPKKALYEFFSLEVWNRLLERYSSENDLKFRAPKPLGLGGLDTNEPVVYMSYLNGYELEKLCQMKRTNPVNIVGQETPLPLFPACALHLGALNRIKEYEGLYHTDYTKRHLIFSPVANVSMGVVDLENATSSITWGQDNGVPVNISQQSDAVFSGNDFKIYLSPFSNELVVELSSLHETKYSIVNVLGQLELSGRVTETVNRIDVGSLEAGLYVVRFSNAFGSYTSKFQKQ